VLELYISFVRKYSFVLLLGRNDGGWDERDLPIDYMTEAHRACIQRNCSKNGDASLPDLPTTRPKKRKSDGMFK